jgi:hypothetical protein
MIKVRLSVAVGFFLAMPVIAERAELRVTAPPASMKLDAAYTKYVDANGYPVVGIDRVDDYALLEAGYLINMMLHKRPDVLEAMVKGGSRMIVMAHDQWTTEVPEQTEPSKKWTIEGKDYSPQELKNFWDRRARGLGGSEDDPLCSCAEENLLAYKGDPYRLENILIHEFAHNIHLRGMVKIDKTFDPRLLQAYKDAMKKGLWKGAYGSTNHHEYFAEGVQSWFSNNRPPDHDHNHVDTREELVAYDPVLAALCEEVFGDTVLAYTKPTTRLHGHLEGYDPKTAPEFTWPTRLQPLTKSVRQHPEENKEEK